MNVHRIRPKRRVDPHHRQKSVKHRSGLPRGLICRRSCLAKSECNIERFDAPLSEELIGELCSLWRQIYAQDYHSEVPVHAGQEKQYNHNTYYFIRHSGKVISVAHITISRGDPRLGGLGDVATIPEYRGRGLALKLCQLAADEFEMCGGEALFLGTANSVAARVYGKVGWQFLPNSDVMLRVTAAEGPQEYISNYFNSAAHLPVEISEGTPRQRIGMIPLIVQPHEWVALDANVELFSTRVSKQVSCMSLYPKYEQIEKSGKWFAAQRSDGATVGLASVKLIDREIAQVDAFTQIPQHRKATVELYNCAMEYALMDNRKVQAVCANRDKLKQSILDELGFEPTDQTISLGTDPSPIKLQIYQLS